jgi:hypothetical protein
MTASRKNKNLGINLTKEVKEFYNENYKMLKKLLKDGNTSYVHGLAELIL